MKNKKQTKNWLKEFRRLLSYSITGGAWFISGYAMFAVCDQIFGLNLWWSKLIANLTGITVNFILERTWVFSDQRRHKKLTVVTKRYFVLTCLNFVIDYYIVKTLKEKFGISPYYGQFISAAFFYLWNYSWYQFWVFAGRKNLRNKPA